MDHSYTNSQGEVTKVTKTGSNAGMQVHAAVNDLAEPPHTPVKTCNHTRTSAAVYRFGFQTPSITFTTKQQNTLFDISFAG